MTDKRINVFRLLSMPSPTECWSYTQALSRDGRPYIQIDGKKHLVYRIVYDLTHSEPLGSRLARHTCDNEWCCNGLDHIIPGDHQQNMDDMKQRERHGQSKHVVNAIRKLASAGRTHSEIADIYGIGRSTVTEIVGNVNYNYDE